MPDNKFSITEILALKPAQLRTALTRDIATNPELSGKIEAMVGWPPRWSQMTACQYAQVALAWAYLETYDSEAGYLAEEIIEMLNKMQHKGDTYA